MGVVSAIKGTGVGRMLVMIVMMLSTLVVLGMQALTLPLWFLSRSLYRRANAAIVQLSWLQLVWLAEWWAGFRITFNFDSEETRRLMPTESTICLATHGSDIDWLLGWVAAQKFGVLGGTKCLLKRELSRVPLLGWSWWFLEYTYISRSWDKDKDILEKSLSKLGEFTFPFWMVIYAEGTRFSQEKYEASLAVAREKGLPQYKHVLLPRTKGFTVALQHLRPHIDSVITFALAYPERRPNFLDLLRGRPLEVRGCISRTAIKDVPQGEEAASKWCFQAYQRMDDQLDDMLAGKAPGRLQEPPKASLLPLLVFAGWAILLLLLTAWLVVPPMLSGNLVPVAMLCAVLVLVEVVTKYGLKLEKKSKLKLKTSKQKASQKQD